MIHSTTCEQTPIKKLGHANHVVRFNAELAYNHTIVTIWIMEHIDYVL